MGVSKLNDHEVACACRGISVLIPSVLVRLGPLDIGHVADLRNFLGLVSDPRATRGRWHSLTATLLDCACAFVPGARSFDKIAEWAVRASDTVLTAVGSEGIRAVAPLSPADHDRPCAGGRRR